MPFEEFFPGGFSLPLRRRFDAVFESEWREAERNRKPLSLVLADIDFFKQYNDHYGHIMGDECLKRVARALEAGVDRPRDFLARYGGEEFALVLPETDVKGGEEAAFRCRDAMHAAGIEHLSSNVAPRLTISLGIGTIVPSAGDLPLAFVEEVDRRLYRAKQSGRNTLIGD